MCVCVLENMFVRERVCVSVGVLCVCVPVGVVQSKCNTALYYYDVIVLKVHLMYSYCDCSKWL